MKIAVTAKGAGLGAWLDPNFETCLQIVIVDDRDRFDAWLNPYREASAKDDPALAIKLTEEKIDILVTGSISPQSLEKLGEAGIKVFCAERGSILELVEAARKHTLPLAD
jgi:predicted Fe-Mo cluster-binding NifX family protein